MKEKKTVSFDKRRTLTLEEVEAFYGITVGSLKKWIRRDGSDGVPALPAYNAGRIVLVYREELDAYIRRFPVGA